MNVTARITYSPRLREYRVGILVEGRKVSNVENFTASKRDAHGMARELIAVQKSELARKMPLAVA